MIKLKSKYAKILYLFFRSFRDGIKGTDYTIEHLRQLLGLSNKYQEWYNFKRYVLIPALKEINEKSDILVVGRYDAYTSAMDGRKREDMTPDEYAKIVIDSMAQKGSRGKGVYKISFRVSENHNTSDEIPTIDGQTYSPDFMYLLKQKDGTQTLNLVVETKDYEHEADLRKAEGYRIECAEEFFKVLKADGINVTLERQLRNDKMVSIIGDVLNK